MLTGRVRWFEEVEGIMCGFIDPEDGGDPVRVWPAGIVDGTLHAGQRVSFEIAPEHLGVQAVNVRVLEESA